MYFKFLLLAFALVFILLTSEILFILLVKKYRLKRKLKIYNNAKKSLKPDLNTIKKLEIK